MTHFLSELRQIFTKFDNY